MRNWGTYAVVAVTSAGVVALLWAVTGAREAGKAATPPPPAPPPTLPARSWKRVALGDRLALEPGTYAGVFELTGLEAAFGDADAIASQLRDSLQWSTLAVSPTPDLVPAAVPLNRSRDNADRYWAYGVLAKAAADDRPSQLRELWKAD